MSRNAGLYKTPLPDFRYLSAQLSLTTFKFTYIRHCLDSNRIRFVSQITSLRQTKPQLIANNKIKLVFTDTNNLSAQAVLKRYQCFLHAAAHVLLGFSFLLEPSSKSQDRIYFGFCPIHKLCVCLPLAQVVLCTFPSLDFKLPVTITVIF